MTEPKKKGRKPGITVGVTLTTKVTDQEKQLIDRAGEHFTMRQMMVAGAQFLLGQMRPPAPHRGPDLP